MTKTILRGIVIGLFVIALLIPTFVTGCGKSTPSTEVTLSSIEVYPTGNVSVVVGQETQFLATATYSDGSSKQVTQEVTWSSSDTGVATISATGLTEAVAAGTTTITATLEDQSDSATLTVSAVTPPEATLSSIEVYPTGNVSVKTGQETQFLATATYSDGSSKQVTKEVTWSSSDTGMATISAEGLTEAVAAGTTTISATLNGQTASATLTVSQATVTIVDSVGRQVTLPQPLTRVVILHSDGAGAIQTLQSTDIVVGTSDYIATKPDAYPLLQGLTTCGSASKPNYEAIIALNPQVVITYIGATGYALPISSWDEKLAGTDIKVVGLDFYNPTTECRDMNTLGIMLGKQARAAEWVTFVQGYLDKVATRVASLTAAQKQRVYFESWTDWKSAAEGSGWHDMLVMAGAINIMAGSGAAYPVASPEAVLAANPDAVIKQADSAGAVLGYYADNTTQAEAKRQALIGRTGWSGINAVINGKVYLVSAEICGGFGKPVCILYLAKILYPDKFTDIDVAAFHKTFCEYQGLPYKGIHVYPTP